MALSPSDRETVAAFISSDAADNNLVVNLTKPQLLAGIDAAASWIMANSGSYNNALPLEVRVQSARFKALLLALVARRLVS